MLWITIPALGHPNIRLKSRDLPSAAHYQLRVEHSTFSRPLHLVVSLDALLIARRRQSLTALASHGRRVLILGRRCNTSLLAEELLVRRRRHGTISSLRRRSLDPALSLTVAVVDVVVRHATTLGVLLRDLFVRRFGVLQDDVPGVQQTWEYA